MELFQENGKESWENKDGYIADNNENISLLWLLWYHQAQTLLSTDASLLKLLS